MKKVKIKTEDTESANMSRAFELFLDDPRILNKDIAKQLGVSTSTVSYYKNHPKWQEWLDKYTYEDNQTLKLKMQDLTDRAIDKLKDYFNGNLEKDDMKALNTCTKLLEFRLEMGGMIKQKPGIVYNSFTEKTETNIYGSVIELINNRPELFDPQDFKLAMETGEIPQTVIKKLKNEDVKVIGTVDTEDN